MRITEGMIANTLLSNLQLGQSRLEKLQQQASSGLKISAPGDDPVSTQQVIQLRGLVQDSDQFARNITTGKAWLEQSDSSMADMGNVVTRARELAVAMANGTYSAQARNNAASELKQLKSELVRLGNSQVAGKYIFGGFVSDKPPFDTTALNNPSQTGSPPAPDPLNGTPVGTFIGTDDAIRMEVDRGAYVDINISGSRLLSGGSPPGSSGVDVIGEMDKLITALTANDVAGIRNSLPVLNAAENQILAARGDVGARMNRVLSSLDNLDSMKISLEKVISSRQDADYLKVMSDLTSQQNAFEAALAATAKTSQLSLLDYLR